jgi:hypothetical protein
MRWPSNTGTDRRDALPYHGGRPQILRSEGYAAVTIRAIAERSAPRPDPLHLFPKSRGPHGALDQRQRAYIQTRYDEMLHDAETGDVREVLRARCRSTPALRATRRTL